MMEDSDEEEEDDCHKFDDHGMDFGPAQANFAAPAQSQEDFQLYPQQQKNKELKRMMRLRMR